MSAPDPFNFEKSFSRLEEILDKMNSGKVTLDESLSLYEEADTLINSCSKRLNVAEKRIEVLIKNRQGGVAMGTDAKPLTQDFQPED